MSTTLVIIGLPSSGKTTVFNALTRSQAETGTYSANPDEPNLATVKVPDPRLDRLTEMFQPQKRVPADVQYLDVAGIAKGIAEKGKAENATKNNKRFGLPDIGCCDPGRAVSVGAIGRGVL